MRIDAPTLADFGHVVDHMRARDVREFLATSVCESAEQLKVSLVRNFRDRLDELLCVYDSHNTPVAVGGLLSSRPNVSTLMFFATDQFPTVAGSLTRFIRKRLFPAFRENGFHRIEATSLADYANAHRWMRALGLKQEARLVAYGKNREDFVVFAWVDNADQARAGI